MSTRLFPAAWSGGCLFSLPALCCLVLVLAGCAAAGRGPAGEAAPEPGETRSLAYGISLRLPDGWQVVHSLEPGAAGKADLEARLRTGQAVQLLALTHPRGQGIDARFLLLLTDSAKTFPPEKEVVSRSAEELDQRAKSFMRRRNEEAVRQNRQPDTLESRMTRESVDGRPALFHRGIGSGPDGQVHYQVWNIYLPGGVGIGVDAVGSTANPGIERQLEAIVRSLRLDGS